MGSPVGIDVRALVSDMQAVEGVEGVHHVHVWALDEGHNALEAHLMVKGSSLVEVAHIRRRVHLMLKERHDVEHSTIEMETEGSSCDPGSNVIGHKISGSA